MESFVSFKRSIVLLVILFFLSSSLWGQWWKGQLHFHTLWSDGHEYPEVAIDLYKKTGYNFVVETEHNNRIPIQKDNWQDVNDPNQSYKFEAYKEYLKRFGKEWVQSRKVNNRLQVRLRPMSEYKSRFEEPNKFLVILGEEVSAHHSPLYTHFNAINIAGFIKRPTESNVRQAIESMVKSVEQHGKENNIKSILIFNHPNWKGVIKVSDMNTPVLRFFEAYNGYSYEYLWDKVMEERIACDKDVPLVYGVATDDAHAYIEHPSRKLTNSFNRGYVVVRSPSLTAESIIKAMNNGDFYASTGVELADLSIDKKRIFIDIKPKAGVKYTTRFIGAESDTDEIDTVIFKKQTGKKAEYRFTGEELYVRAEITSTKPKPFLETENEFEKAWIQPISPAKLK